MANLYLDFVENLEKGSKDFNDFFNTSLKEQYESIKPKLKIEVDDFEQFVRCCFPIYEDKYYYISMPGLNRTIEKNHYGKDCIYNIVIRPEKDSYVNHFMPNDKDIIFVGDLVFNNIITVKIKGIELIDSAMTKFGEIKVECTAFCALSKKTLNTGSLVPDFGTKDLHNAVLDNDFVNKLCNEVYPVSNPKLAVKELNKWEKYIDFRKYYLGKQSEKSEKIDLVTVCDSFVLPGNSLKKNKDNLSKLLLDNIEDFGKNEQVILSKNVEGSEYFPLIRVDIRKNRKEIFSESLNRKGKETPKYEINLNRYTKDSMGLSVNPPQYDENGDLKKGIKFSQYLLGERFLFTHSDIEPDCTSLESEYEKRIDKSIKAIDIKYDGIIKNEVSTYIENKKSTIDKKYEGKFNEYKENLENDLDKDVSENKDKDVNLAYISEIKKKTDPYLNKIKELQSKNIGKRKKKKDKEKKLEENTIQIKELSKQIESIKASIQLKPFYVERNTKLVANHKKNLEIDKNSEISSMKKERTEYLRNKYKSQVNDEKRDVEKKLLFELEKLKNEKIENETIRQYQIYFEPENLLDEAKTLKKIIENGDYKYLTFDNRKEKAKISRQEKALYSISKGFVKNPYLPSYLFSPKTLKQSNLEEKEIDWCLENLNDKQKEAVRKALVSDSLFLLQGPPGTGKTQVIAELTAQYVKQGKKVLISSETHKAIDNVFERLPKIPEIMPLRLIPSNNNKETNYSPEKLVDNLYFNIRGNLEKQIRRFENFEETKNNFDEKIRKLKSDYNALLDKKAKAEKIKLDIDGCNREIKSLKKKMETFEQNVNDCVEEKDKYIRTKRSIENCLFDSMDVDENYIDKFKTQLNGLLKNEVVFNDVSLNNINTILNCDLEQIKNEIKSLDGEDEKIKLEQKAEEYRKQLMSLMDPISFDPPKEGDPNFEEYNRIQTKYIEINKQRKNIKNDNLDDIHSTLIYKIFPNLIGKKELLEDLPVKIITFRVNIQSIIDSLISLIEKKMKPIDNMLFEIDKEKNKYQAQINERKNEIQSLHENDEFEQYEELSSGLKQKITEFFNDFDIIREYSTIDEAFKVMDEEWHKLKTDFEKNKELNSKKIPIYSEICKYLSQEEILVDDRRTYTRSLYNCANVFGITCTSRDRFTSSQLQELNEYGINSIDIKTQGIDVVIIDEVSKSSFLDLLIPILYGKTIILCGDHRQLPPMYDLKHLREEDFEDLDSDKITKEINDKYTKLYESCYFKELYEKVPSDFKVMLNKQYRCHSHIMEVFNHFYGGSKNGLMVGKKQQDNEKQHNLTVAIKGNIIIDPRHHVYFVDCNQKESTSYEGSTSKINEQEANVAMALLRELDNSSKALIKSGRIKVDPKKNIDQRPSVGVICTYGDQAGFIKKKRRNKKFSNFSGKQDEKLVISTVDDFQGDERDIIIVSMVRNPKGHRFNLDFIKEFERLNVAFSRARKMLIILGAKDFLIKYGNIDLPDLNGNHLLDRKNFPLFKEIIDTIDFRGRVLKASDIVEEEE